MPLKSAFFSYLGKYFLIIILGEGITVFHLTSIYKMPWIVLPIYNYLAIRYGIIYSARKKKEDNFQKLLPILQISTTLGDIFFLWLINASLKNIVILALSNVLELFYLGKKELEKNPKRVAEYYIKEYYQKNHSKNHDE